MDLGDVADSYATAIMTALTREYPHGWRHHADGPVRLEPRQAHPAFYGCYDWHSAVHMHWALVRLLRRVPERLDATAARRVLDEHLTENNLAAELAYLGADPTWERPYGWGWALELAEELTGWDDPDAARWAAALHPLADLVSRRFLEWLPGMNRPVRAGMHLNSAFGLTRACRWARRLNDSGDPALLQAITSAAERWFGDDTAYDNRWEPDAWDFLSPGLAEADLMLELFPDRFDAWLARFLPGLPVELGAWADPVAAGDRSDGQVAHLDGLNLHRALVLGRLGERMQRPDVLAAARRHASAGLRHVVGGHYMSEHWLASFAILLVHGTSGVAD